MQVQGQPCSALWRAPELKDASGCETLGQNGRVLLPQPGSHFRCGCAWKGAAQLQSLPAEAVPEGGGD